MRNHFNSARNVATMLIVMVLSALLASCVPVEKQQAEYKWKAITNLSGAGDLDAAIAEGHKLLQNNPNDPGVLYWLADAYMAKGEKEEAEKLYLKIINESTYDPYFFVGTHTKLGWMYMSNIDKALPHFEQALQIIPLNRDALVPLNKIYLYQGRYNKALSGFGSLLSNPGINEYNILNFNKLREGYRGKALALLGLGDPEAALAILDQAETEDVYSPVWDRSLVYYATGQSDKLQELYGKRGWLGVEIKDYVGADGRQSAEVVSLASGAPAENADIRAGDIVLQIEDMLIQKAEDLSAVVYNQSAGQSVTIKMLRNNQPLAVKVTLGSFLDSIVAWVEQQPEILPILAQRETLSRVEQEIANHNLRQALQLCLDHLWVSAPGSDQRPAMKQAIAIVRRLDPPPAIPQEAVRHVARAEAFLKSSTDINGTEKAYEEFEAALRLAPWWADVWFNLGIAQKNAGDPAAAIESLQMFLLAAPNDPAAPQVQREIYSLEVEEENPYQWRGRWTDGTSIYHLQRNGDQASVIFVKTDSIDENNSFRSGDLHFSGRINGNRLTGKRVFHGSNDNEKRCFGETYDKDTTVEMGDNGYTMTAHWQSMNYLIKSCEITGGEEQTRKYYRLP